MKTQNSFSYKNIKADVILPGLIRVQSSKAEDFFTEERTQKVWNRESEDVDITFRTDGKKLYIYTTIAQVCIDATSGRFLFAKTDAGMCKNHKKGNLKGTARTLDQKRGAVKLQDGVVSKSGVAILDDSRSLLIAEDGMPKMRKGKGKDYYIFAYGSDYVASVRALYHLCGPTPLIPRYTLGNWWSRYKAYTQEEYLSLMERFIKEQVPLTVATVDMDWHWVNIKKRLKNQKVDFGKKTFLGKGWTGYSWNTDLFPDYKEFLKKLKEKNLKTTLNLHPASGVRAFENQYEDMAKALSINPKKKKAIPFDVTNPKFMEAYFKYLHHPYEEDGVDFWWIDWQQGKKSALKGLDPLWALNHFHTLSADRTNKRPLILSRYAEIGSHRYPIGFSGDTWIRWSALNFQPYFTITAANCGYTWWSHDIGGHVFGGKDEELYVRWIQFGVFSPILRLHSSNTTRGKEPWNYSKEICKVAKNFLRLRAQLIPYIYTMNYRNHKEGRALCEPLYYSYKEKWAYQYENEYLFGNQLLVCPVTQPMNPATKKATTRMYLPKGRWTNLFTDEVIEGDREITVESSLEEMPVFAKEGAILPLSMNLVNGADNPSHLMWRIFSGEGEFSLYEDDGETKDYKDGQYSITKVCHSVDGNEVFVQLFGTTEETYLPKMRTHVFCMENIIKADRIEVSGTVKDISYKVTQEENKIMIEVADYPITANLCIKLGGVCAR